VYGDEVATNIRNVSDGLLAAGRITPAQYNVLEVFFHSTVSRTGYNETDLTDNKASNTKMDYIFALQTFEMKI
jgi:hypothetical protein